MRFLGNALQFAAIVTAFWILDKILPLCALSFYTWIAHVYLCFSVAFWITELTQDYFFTARVDVKNKAVLVTGCDTGFGNAIAKILDLRGYQVFACCLDKTSDGASELKEKCSSKLKVIQMDVTDDRSIEMAVKCVEEDLGKSELWAIVNNAGVLKGFHTELSTMKDYELCMEVNALGVVRVTKAFLPFLRKSRGRVVNICSMASRTRCPYLGPYIMSKSAAVAFTEVLMQEMREFGIRAISIEPEFFRTPMCSEEYVMNVLNESFPEVDDEIKSAYGTNYIKKSREVYWAIFSRNSANVQPVFSAIESAVSLQNPADIYKPTRNMFIRLLFFVSERVPKFFNEMAVTLLFFFMGLPAPRKGISILYRFFKSVT